MANPAGSKNTVNIAEDWVQCIGIGALLPDKLKRNANIYTGDDEVNLANLFHCLEYGYKVSDAALQLIANQFPEYAIPLVKPAANPTAVNKLLDTLVSKGERKTLDEWKMVQDASDTDAEGDATAGRITGEGSGDGTEGREGNEGVPLTAEQVAARGKRKATDVMGTPMDTRKRAKVITIEEDDAVSGFTEFKWLRDLSLLSSDKDAQYGEDGRLKLLGDKDHLTMADGSSVLIDDIISSDITAQLDADFWASIAEINGDTYYDAEENATGGLKKSLYLLLPAGYKPDICEMKDFGRGAHQFRMPTFYMAGIYVLAKAQAKAESWQEDHCIKWALLRCMAYITGWFDAQKKSRYAPAPRDALITFQNDLKGHRTWVTEAYQLCAFVPFFIEFNFRTYGSGFNQASSAEYIKRAEKFAASGQMGSLLKYLDADKLFGSAFLWIGMKRVMDVLKSTESSDMIPAPFKVRSTSPPAGQAIITTSAQIIATLTAANIWNPIKEAAGYKTTYIARASRAIVKDPFKYHMMPKVYGLQPIVGDEKVMIDEAKKEAMIYAPILHAACETVLKNTDLGNVKVLKKYSDQNRAFYDSAVKLFKVYQKSKMHNIAELFLNRVFDVSGLMLARREKDKQLAASGAAQATQEPEFDDDDLD